MGKILLLFIALPAVELTLLIELGRRIGTATTLALIVVTGVLGASLARRQGLRVVRSVQRELAEGRLPTASLLDGLLILIASALLVTPGVLTDLAGFLCLHPGFRSILQRELRRRFERAVAEQRLHVEMRGVDLGGDFAPPFERGPIIDVTPDRDTDEPDDTNTGRRGGERR